MSHRLEVQRWVRQVFSSFPAVEEVSTWIAVVLVAVSLTSVSMVEEYSGSDPA
jgi:hypothetical protein